MNRVSAQRLRALLATTFLVSAACSEAAAQPKPGAVAAASDAEAVTLDQLSVEGAGAAQSGTIGYLQTRTRTATKTDTPLIDTPQSVTVVTQQQIRDQGFQSLNEAIRYVPGVIPHQGEGNRDDVVIRGQRSNADFFVNGIRDDVQYFRDLYNIQRIEVLKGPNAMIFGRGGGGGIINRVLKEADGVPIREVLVQGGEYWNKRVAIDAGDRVSDSVFFRLNGVFEDTATYRDFVDIRRYGVNPTMTFLLGPATTLKLSYEYFHDDRTADRGIPSQFGRPYRYRQNISTFFGNPDLSYSKVDANIATAVLDHLFESGVQMHSQLRFADYQKFYQNIFPGGPVNAAGTQVPLSAYNNETPRTNYFSQNDFTYKFDTGPLHHTLLGGFELGYQEGLAYRQTGFFDSPLARDGGRSLVVNPLSPVSRVPVSFRNLPTDANSAYNLGLAAVYAQDQIEVSEHLQFLGGLRYDHFDFSSRDRRTNVVTGRIDDLVSPRAGVVVKPLQNLAFYGSYSVSYLPSAGDQFSTLTPGTAIAQPEKFVNSEIGVKYDVTPALQLTGALYNLDRTNQRLADPNNPGFFILSGSTRTQGAEIGINGYITDWWQAAGGYAFTDARITGATSTTIVPGNTVGLVPFNTFTLWNKFDVTERFSLGIGYINQTHTFASSDNTVRLPGFSRFDLGLFYRMSETVRAQVNIENLFDRRYIATADGNNNITPGAPRLIRVQLIAQF
ncbi:TonB-dependent receptor [Methylobacterium oxalidis]|uniref:Ligand-gated channel n=1 Tax=Methylobacterium oxalidis TaxID=944322 RepID=A0A512JAU9_9HYPH|nr:TonB-dependent siderophore receptor [Methylobacterium oxalidis]GEP07092.1 ligand-gated channel [Methylobacterium oxalidis]GJE33986.1 putative TonB-dependent receptor BfrD [Methylobacterium oxalidis]GLS66159.1 ligand-gated channel [Methylobacterium oxalidis]